MISSTGRFSDSSKHKTKKCWNDGTAEAISIKFAVFERKCNILRDCWKPTFSLMLCKNWYCQKQLGVTLPVTQQHQISQVRISKRNTSTQNWYISRVQGPMCQASEPGTLLSVIWPNKSVIQLLVMNSSS